MDLAHKMCNLECLKNEAPVAEFVGPVKIVLVDPPPRLYKRRVWGSALIVLAHMMIGATTMTLFYYSLTFSFKFGTNLHIFLCTAGFQLCLPSGILMINNLNGAAATMKTGEIKTQHIFLQIFGMACAIFGSIGVFFFDGLSLSEFTIHSLTGMAACGLGIATVALGPIVHCTKDTAQGVSKMIHILFGVLTLISSTLCFILGLIKPHFMSWIPVPEILTCTIIFVAGNKELNELPGAKEQPENSKQLIETTKKSDKPKNLPEIKSIMSSGKSRNFKIGPIKILVIESKREYCRTIWCAIGTGISHIMIGATNMAILFYYMKSQDVHALTCTLAYHFFSAEAILSLNYANGWSTPMRLRHRRFVHVSLQLCAMVCAIMCSMLVIVDKGASVTAHGITGIITGILTIITFLIGPGALYGKNYFKLIHISLGMPTFLLSSICFCTGLLTEPFRSWADPIILYLLLSFIVFYSIFIVATPFLKCMIRL